MSFKYKNAKKYIITDLDLDINQGEFIGIAGPSGCGKSSLIKVISKLEKATGDIKIDGFDIDSLSRRDIAKEIALVPQSPFLISASIKDRSEERRVGNEVILS